MKGKTNIVCKFGDICFSLVCPILLQCYGLQQTCLDTRNETGTLLVLWLASSEIYYTFEWLYRLTKRGLFCIALSNLTWVGTQQFDERFWEFWSISVFGSNWGNIIGMNAKSDRHNYLNFTNINQSHCTKFTQTEKNSTSNFFNKN